MQPGGTNGSGGIGPEFEVVEQEKYRYEFDPNHPDADENGMVRYPDVDLVREMTQLVSANRLYEANLSAVEAEKQIIKRSFEI
jgi:flagellar basal-body rod protein FlgC